MMIFLQKGRGNRNREGHPWVYRTEIATVEGNPQPGDIVAVYDWRGKFLGRGYYNPASMITVRLLTSSRQEPIDADFFRERVRQAWSLREKLLAGEPESDSCRVIFGEADFLPGFIADKFADVLVVQSLTLGIDRWQEIIVDELIHLVKPRAVYARNDQEVRQLEGLPLYSRFLFGEANSPVVIRENGFPFLVDFAFGQKTGHFLDQRQNRAALKPFASGARVLDCFCHTGGFSIHAALYGAKEVTAVDISPQALAVARENARLNGVEERLHLVEANAFDFLREQDKKGEKYDLVILDPPAFTKSRSTVAAAARGYKEINLRAMRILKRGGYLVTCSCSYHMTEPEFLAVVEDAARDAKRRLQLIELRRQSQDHPVLIGYPESHYLKCLIFRVL